MAIPSYDYGYLVNPLYRRKALTGSFPDSSLVYGAMGAINEDKRRRDFEAARLAEEQKRTALAQQEIEFSKKQARMQNVSDLTSLGIMGYGTYKYFNPSKPATTPGTGLAPVNTFAGRFSESPYAAPMAGSLVPSTYVGSLSTSAVPAAESALGTGLAPVGATDFSVPFAESGYATLSAGSATGAGAASTAPTVAAGAGGTTAAGAGGATGALSPAANSLVGSVSSEYGGLAGGAVAAGAGMVGDVLGSAIGGGIGRMFGLHEKTAKDIAGVGGTFLAVTAATGNPIIGGVAALGVAIWDAFF